MNKKKIQIRITEDGKFYAETLGMKGKECLDYISMLEELLEAETVDSSFKQEYYDTSVQLTTEQRRIIKEGE